MRRRIPKGFKKIKTVYDTIKQGICLNLLIVLGVLILDTSAIYKTTEAYSEIQSQLPKQDIISTVKISAVGDTLFHMPIVNSGLIGEDEYNFDSIFLPVKKYIESADFAIADLEIPLAGKQTGYSGYPTFNSPDELADSLKNVGFDMVTNATNHSLDKGYQGLVNTINTLKEREILQTGTFINKEDTKPLIKSIKDINFAFMAYTYGTNGIPLPKGKEYCVNMLYDKQKILEDIKYAKEQKSDVIIFSLHMGNEYERLPSKEQIEMADFLFENGVDIILGCHVHVIQPMLKKKVITVDNEEKECYVVYSMGNFIGNQRQRYRDTGLIVNVEIEKNLTTNKINITNFDYITTWVDRDEIEGKYNFRIIPVEETIQKYENGYNDKLLTYEDYQRLVQAKEETDELIENYKADS